MKRLLKDESGNLFWAQVISSVPQGFTDITDEVVVSKETESLDASLIEIEEIPAVPAIAAIEGVQKHWTNGADVVYSADDIPTITDEDGNASLDPSWYLVPAVQAVAEVPEIPAYSRTKKKSGADQVLRQQIIDKLSTKRQPLLAEADIMINKLEDKGQDTSSWRAYRQALRDITEPFKSLVDGSWKVAVESIDVDKFEFPNKPE